jgi:xylulokinase
MKQYLIGVDVGTYSSKGVLVSEDGRLSATHTVEHGLEMPKPGYFEHDAEKVWWHDFVEIVKNLFLKSGVPPNQIAGVGASAIGSCVLPIDAQGQPLRGGILYGIDTRAEKEIQYLEETLGKKQIFEKCAVHLSAQASGPKILWVRNHEPEVFRKARWFLTSQAYLVFKLTGEATIDVYTAGGYAPLFDVRALRWDEGFARHIVSIDRLPKANWSCEVAGKVTSAAARETGLAEGTPVITGTTDAAAEAISAGVAEFGDMMIMFGSSAFFVMKTEQMTQTQAFWSGNFLEKGTFAFTGGMSTAGSLTTWFRDHFARLEIEREKSGQENAFARLAREAADSPIGAKGLVALPYFEGERTPLHDPKAKGVLFGLSLKHTRGDVYRSILEGVGFGIRHNLEAMAEERVRPKRIFAVGGGTKNETWMQMVADIADIDMIAPSQQIGASYGDAFMAGVGAGLFGELHEIGRWVSGHKAIKADPEAHERYAANYGVFRSLYSATSSLMHELSDSQLAQDVPTKREVQE